ncbi:MAG: glycine cleavage system aminomethyltransferase GcvT, partial [Alphaproteobacteria bacterium]|nr:glycine cleavage system aminomethyltransferase GcvT [Alphaproteobacteria bacterium]
PQRPIAMGYVAIKYAHVGATLSATLRDKRIEVDMAALPFVPHRYFKTPIGKDAR